MSLADLFKAIKESTLSKAQLEQYEQQLAHLASEMQLQLAELKKDRAIFMLEHRQNDPTLSAIALKIEWDGSEKGLKLIQLNDELKAVARVLSSIKTRIFQTY